MAAVLLVASGCGAKSSLPIGEGGSTPGPGPDPKPQLPLPPPPPACSEVAFEACVPWESPVVITSLGASRQGDIAWQGSVFIVAYGQEEQSRVALVDLDGNVLADELLGEGGDPRLAYHLGAGSGAAVTERGYRWLGGSGLPVASFEEDTPFSSATMNATIAPVSQGFVAVVGPTSDPGGNATSVAVALSTTAGIRSEDDFYASTPTPRIDRTLGPDLLLERFGYEANRPDGGIERVQFAGADGALSLFGTPSEPLFSTSFVDAFFTVGSVGYFVYGSEFAWATVALDANGVETTHTVLLDEDGTGAVAMERLGTADALGDVVVTAAGLVPNGLGFARYDPVAGAVDGTLPLGSPGDVPRMARWPRGVAVVWTDATTRQTVVDVIDCCVD
jgi:hypothetical protein